MLIAALRGTGSDVVNYQQTYLPPRPQDVYSYALVLWSLLTLEEPWADMTEEQVWSCSGLYLSATLQAAASS